MIFLTINVDTPRQRQAKLQSRLSKGSLLWYNDASGEGTIASSASLQILRSESHFGDLPRTLLDRG